MMIELHKNFNVTEKETELIIDEMTKRMKDIVYVHAETKLRDLMKEFFEIMQHGRAVDTYKTTYEVTFVFGDIEQIIGRIRREKNE